MTAIRLHDVPSVTGRIDRIELRLRHLEQDAARAHAAELEQLAEDRIRVRVRFEMWFTGFKIVAVAQIVVAVAVILYRSW